MFFVHFLGIFYLFFLYLMNMNEDWCLQTAVKFQEECKECGKLWPNDRDSDSWSKGCEFESRSGRDFRWGEWMYSASFHLQYHDEVPLSKSPNPQLLPGRRSINGCPLLRVCVHGVCVHCCVCALGWVNAEHEFRVWVTILGCMSRHFLFLKKKNITFS